jgi:site-specific recombinase XerD
MRDAMRDKSYQLTPIGAEVAAYLRHKRKRLTDASYRGYESSLDKLARHFADLDLKDLEPPVGTQRLEEYLDHRWGEASPGTYNVNLSITSDFFKWAVIRGYVHGNPCTPIERARKRAPLRTTFSRDERVRIIAEQESLRDRIALRLLFDYGLRKGALQRVQFRHFDHVRKRLTIFTKGEKVRELPIPDRAFWDDLGRYLIENECQPHHYLMASFKVIPRGNSGQPPIVKTYPEKPMSSSAGMHRWWYGCLQRAGIVPTGTTSGERMHKARHTAGQRVLDATGDLKLVQKLLGHESIRTTGDIYVDYDIAEWGAKLSQAWAKEQDDE